MSSLNQRTVQRKFFLQTQIESQSFSTKIRTETEMLPYWNVTNFSLWRCEDFSIVGVVGAAEMCLHNSVMLWKICRDFSQWCTEYPNYYSQWPFISISDFFCWVLVCSGSDSRADVSAPWLKLLPSCLSFGTFWFKMLHFFMRTSEGQHSICLHTLENDDWKETTYQSLWDTYGQLQILCMETWAPLEVRGCAVPFTSCGNMLDLSDNRMKEGGSSFLPVHWQYGGHMELALYFCCHWLSCTQMCMFLLKPHRSCLPVMHYPLFYQYSSNQNEKAKALRNVTNRRPFSIGHVQNFFPKTSQGNKNRRCLTKYSKAEHTCDDTFKRTT